VTGADRLQALPDRSPPHQPGKLGLAEVDWARRRWELVDGMLIVRPTPLIEHQRAVARLMTALQRNCPRSLEVLPGPITFQPIGGRSFVPDLVVLARTRTTQNAPQVAPPRLIAEVTDSNSQTLDREVKPGVYASAGVDHYWLFDPDVPEFVAYRRAGDRYVEVGYGNW
jgi:Uma2 family endonuclease